MIYVVSHFYLPICNPPANRMGHLVRILVEKYGKENVLVVTGRPNYPNGQLAPRDKWRFRREETGRYGETVIHLYEIPSPFQGFFRKTLGYLSFGVSVFLYFLAHASRRSDVLLVTSGPIFPAYAVYLLSRLKRNLRYVLDVRDLLPQSFPGMGFMTPDSLTYKALNALSNRTYRAAVKAVGAVPGICEFISSVIGAEKVSLVYNPVDTDLVKPLSGDELEAFRRENPRLFSSPEKTRFLFAGSLSTYVGLMTLMRALKELLSTTGDFLFFFIGEGEDKKALESFADENGLREHVVFLPHMERTDLVKYICAADFCFFSLKADPIFRMAVPTKALEYLACDKFIVAALAGPFAEELRRNDLALVSPPEDPDALARNLVALIRRREDYLARKQRARVFVVDQFSLDQFTTRVLRLFDDLVAPPGTILE